jgi:hypothetical protein
MVGDSFQEQLEFVQAERLRDEVVRACPHCLNRQSDGAISSHDNDLDVWLQAFDLPQDFEAASAGQVQIKKDNVDAFRINEPKRLLGRSCGNGVVSESNRSFFAGFADEAVVVNDEQVEERVTLDCKRLNWIG